MDCRTGNVPMYKKLPKLFDDHKLSRKLRFLTTARTSLGAGFPESLHITLTSEEYSSSAGVYELLLSNLEQFTTADII